MTETDAWEYLVWVDIETSGVDYPASKLLEVAAVVTSMTPEFREVGEPFNRVLELGDLQISQVDPHVLEMHSKNGLWHASQGSRLKRETMVREMKSWFDTTTEAIAGARFCWAGRSLHFDLQWIAGDSGANLESIREFDHRRFDVRPVMTVASMAGISFGVPEEIHRALPDVMGDIEMARALVKMISRDRS